MNNRVNRKIIVSHDYHPVISTSGVTTMKSVAHSNALQWVWKKMIHITTDVAESPAAVSDRSTPGMLRTSSPDEFSCRLLVYDGMELGYQFSAYIKIGAFMATGKGIRLRFCHWDNARQIFASWCQPDLAEYVLYTDGNGTQCHPRSWCIGRYLSWYRSPREQAQKLLPTRRLTEIT